MEDAVAFCTDFIAKYRQTQTHIDYCVTEDSIKIFFYFKSKNSARYFNVTDELNSSLPKFNLYKMCDFYMKLVNTSNSPKYVYAGFFYLLMLQLIIMSRDIFGRERELFAFYKK